MDMVRYDQRSEGIGRERNRSYLRTHVIPIFGHRPIVSIEHSEVEEWVSHLNACRKPATVRLAHGIFSRLMQSAVDQDRISSNPCSGINLLPIDQEEMRFLLPHQVALLAESIDPRYRAYVLVQAYGGLRSGEMAALKPAQVDLTTGRIEVVASVSEVGGRLVWGPPKTRRGRRTIVLPNEVAEELSHHMDNWVGDETIFARPEVVCCEPQLGDGASGIRAVEKADLVLCVPTICATPPSRFGSKLEATHWRSLGALGTPVWRSLSTATAICSPTPTLNSAGDCPGFTRLRPSHLCLPSSRKRQASRPPPA